MDSESTWFSAIVSVPNTAHNLSNNVTSKIQVHNLPTQELQAGQVYDVKIRAVNNVGHGPNSTLVSARMTRKCKCIVRQSRKSDQSEWYTY